MQPSEVIDGGIAKPAPLTARFDPLLIVPHLKVAQRKWVFPLLCKNLLNDIIAEATVGGQINISNYNPNLGQVVQKFKTQPDYEEFWRTCFRQYIAHVTILEAAPFIGVQLGNAGFFANDAHYGTNIGIEGIKWWIDNAMDRAETMKQMMVEYLCENVAKFPLWGDCHCKTCGCESTDLDDGCCSRCAPKCGGVEIEKWWGIITY